MRRFAIAAIFAISCCAFACGDDGSAPDDAIVSDSGIHSSINDASGSDVDRATSRDAGVIVYADVPGLTPSDPFSFRVREPSTMRAFGNRALRSSRAARPSPTAAPSGIGRGTPIDTVMIFSSPILTNRPSASDSNVHVVQVGETPPSDVSWTTLAFAPGAHDIGLAFPVHASLDHFQTNAYVTSVTFP